MEATMGEPDLLVKQLFVEETKVSTHGVCAWSLPSPITLKEVHPDGLITVLNLEAFLALPAPWCLLDGAHEALMEVKMPGDHMESRHWLRALMRRLARDVALHEMDGAEPRPLYQPLWWLSPHIPKWIQRVHRFQRVALGCYRVEGWPFEVLWICANELPLDPALIPFLCARSGKARDAFVLWVRHVRPREWMVRLMRVYNMTDAQIQEILDEIVTPGDDDSRRFSDSVVSGMFRIFPDLEPEPLRREREARLAAEQQQEEEHNARLAAEQQREEERRARLAAEAELAALKASLAAKPEGED